MKLPSIPTFVLVGQPNVGKTTIASTLTANDQASISKWPGTTVKREKYTIQGDDGPLLVLYDTPGFQNPGKLVEWLRLNSTNIDNPAKAFLEDATHGIKLADETEILTPISKGAVAVLVANPSLRPNDYDRLSGEILSLCKAHRIGVFNLRTDGKDYREIWENMMGAVVTIWHPFNPFTADGNDCIEFIESMKGLGRDWDKAISTAADQLREFRSNQFKDASRLIVRTIREMIQVEADVEIRIGKEAEAQDKAEKDLIKKIDRLEKDFRKKMRSIFRHHEERWQLPEELEFDLYAEKTWQLFGFSKNTISFACAASGAGIGALLDAALAGITFGVFTGIGFVIGSLVSMKYADKVADTAIIPGKKLGGKSIRARIERRGKVPGNLLGRLAAYARAVAYRPHGQRTTGEKLKPDEALTKKIEDANHEKRVVALIEYWWKKTENSKVLEAEAWFENLIYKHLSKS